MGRCGEPHSISAPVSGGAPPAIFREQCSDPKRDYASECFVAEKEALTACSTSQAFNAAAQRDSKIQVRIGEDAKREASAMKAIAVVTMTFLPATFVSTLFGMSFFSFEPSSDADASSFVVSRDYWIFWALSVPLTIATLALWLLWSRGRARLRRVNPASGAVHVV